jgi:hypothetical protein
MKKEKIVTKEDVQNEHLRQVAALAIRDTRKQKIALCSHATWFRVRMALFTDPIAREMFTDAQHRESFAWAYASKVTGHKPVDPHYEPGGSVEDC